MPNSKFLLLLVASLLGCGDSPNLKVYVNNRTNRDVIVQFPMDDSSCHALVPAQTQKLVIEHDFGGVHSSIFEDAKTHKVIPGEPERDARYIASEGAIIVDFPPIHDLSRTRARLSERGR
jgi:hypothetical protein